MDTMEKLHLFSTRRSRERKKQAALQAEQCFSVETKIAAFQADQLAMRTASEEAAARSPTEKSEAQSKSSAERRKFTPAV